MRCIIKHTQKLKNEINAIEVQAIALSCGTPADCLVHLDTPGQTAELLQHEDL